jgi:biotin transport system substrate-specific component
MDQLATAAPPTASPTAGVLPGSLADRLRAHTALPSVGYDVLLVVLGALVVALSARVAIPMPWGVPITGQTFAILLVSAALGFRRGGASLMTYLGAGAIGLPVFAGGIGGAHVFVGPTAGYLVAFVPAAMLVGALAERGWDRTPLRTLAAMTLGTIVILAGGLAWAPVWILVAAPIAMVPHLAEGPLVGILSVFTLPFLPGAAIKIALAMACLPLAWKLVGRRG